MKTLRRFVIAAGTIAAGLGLWLSWCAAPAAAPACIPRPVGIDTTYGQDWPTCFLGRAVGETFLALDSLITSISVWTWHTPGETSYGAPMTLWITRTSSTGRPLTAPLYPVLLDGPILRVPADSAAERLIRVRYAFDPPFSLPGPGFYAFFVQDPCLLLFSLLADTSRDVYPRGHLWRTPRAGPFGCQPYSPYYYPEDARSDLIFEVEFCKPAPTPVRPTSWGHLKTIYR